MSDAEVEKILVRTLESTPRDATHWSTRGMAKVCGLSQSTVSRIWRAFALQPHRSQPVLPMRPGQVERRSYDYQRHGTTTLFAALDTASGRVVGEFHQRHRAVEFRKFRETIEDHVPPSLDVHLILDNYGAHKTPAIRRHPRFHVHFTPTGGSWFNLVERWFAALTEKQPRRGVHRSTRELEDAIRQYLGSDQSRSSSLRVGQNRRPDPGELGTLLYANLWLRTLEGAVAGS